MTVASTANSPTFKGVNSRKEDPSQSAKAAPGPVAAFRSYEATSPLPISMDQTTLVTVSEGSGVGKVNVTMSVPAQTSG